MAEQRSKEGDDALFDWVQALFETHGYEESKRRIMEGFDAISDWVQELFESHGIEGKKEDLWKDVDALQKLAIRLAYEAGKPVLPDVFKDLTWQYLEFRLIRRSLTLASKFSDLPLKWQLAIYLTTDAQRQKHPPSYMDVRWINRLSSRQNLRAASRDAWLLFELYRLDNASAAARILANELQQSQDWLRQRIYIIRREGPSLMRLFCILVICAELTAGRKYQKNRVDRVADEMEELVADAIRVLLEYGD